MNPRALDYRTVFDLAEVGYQHWGFSVVGLGLIVTAACLRVFGKRAMRGLHPLLSKTLPNVLVAVAVVFTLVAFVPTYSSYRDLRGDLDAGQFQVVEGPVEEFQGAPNPTGRWIETFTVGGTRFSISDQVMSAGFHTTQARGGPIEAGVLVRIAHVDGHIVRLELAEPQIGR